jgi:hypothetical protein
MENKYNTVGTVKNLLEKSRIKRKNWYL